MSLRSAVCALALCALPCSVHAAEISRIASSFEEDDPFGFFIDLGFERTLNRMAISRERLPGTNGEVPEVNELRFTGTDTRLNIDVHMGLWHDLEFHFGVPIVFQQDRQWEFANGTTAADSELTRSCIDATGTPYNGSCASDPARAGSQPILAVPSSSFRGGIDNLRFGLAYALFNEKKDDTKPTWLVGIDYTAPTSQLLNPSVPATTSNSRGPIGDRIHRYRFYTTLSKKIGVADPYFQAHWTIPYRGPGWYSNCDNAATSISMGHPLNCGVAPWTRSETGIMPGGDLGVTFGSEFTAFEETTKKQKIAFDLRGITNYVGRGRYFNELSDLLGKLVMTEGYYQLGGSLRVAAHAAEYAHFNVGFTLLYNTEHLLSDEPLTIGTSSVPNPNFDWRTDAPSRRIRAKENTNLIIDLSASFIF